MEAAEGLHTNTQQDNGVLALSVDHAVRGRAEASSVFRGIRNSGLNGTWAC